ncbi:MAG: DUF4012 domain-containing protein [Chloroflexi bacterium]|nr:DUF4012 domain-containing protein [Chloroflexota bacterium]
MSNRESKIRRRIIWLLLLAGLIILFIWAGLKAWRTVQIANSLLSRQAQAQQLLAEGPGNVDPEAAEALVLGLRGDVVDLRQEVGFLMPILPYLGWLPKVGSLASAAPQLMDMADSGTEAAAYAFRGLKPAMLILQDEENTQASLVPQLLPILDGAKSDLAQASLAMDDVVAARQEIADTEALPWRVRSLLELADQWLPLGQDGLKVALVLPELLGYKGPRRYLIMAQNEDELRATGGYISGAGMIEVDNGRIVKIEFQDASLVDAWGKPFELTKPYGDPPKALSDFMLLDLFLFRDANFWPDYTVSAEKAMDLYSYGQDVAPLDGAIAIDQQFIKLLLSGTGPVLIPDSGEVVSEDNAIASLQDAWSLEEGVGNRKAFLGTFALAIHNRLENELWSVDPINLVRAMGQAVQNKHLQLYMRDPQVSPVLADVGWDGQLVPPIDHDALMIVDSNMGYNKANVFVERDISYHVRLAEDGSGQADLTVTHIHTAEDNGEPCWQSTLQEYEDGEPYQALTDKCYWNYLRVYVPEESRLDSGPQHVVPGDTWFGGYDWDHTTEVSAELPGFTTFANFMLLPRDAEVTSQYRYELPAAITQKEGQLRHYQLRLYRQAGAPVHPVQVAVTLPYNAQLVSAVPQPTAQEANTVYFTTDLDSDKTLTVTYRQR